MVNVGKYTMHGLFGYDTVIMSAKHYVLRCMKVRVETYLSFAQEYHLNWNPCSSSNISDLNSFWTWKTSCVLYCIRQQLWSIFVVASLFFFGSLFGIRVGQTTMTESTLICFFLFVCVCAKEIAFVPSWWTLDCFERMRSGEKFFVFGWDFLTQPMANL